VLYEVAQRLAYFRYLPHHDRHGFFKAVNDTYGLFWRCGFKGLPFFEGERAETDIVVRSAEKSLSFLSGHGQLGGLETAADRLSAGQKPLAIGTAA
jgi:hypothetical protein